MTRGPAVLLSQAVDRLVEALAERRPEQAVQLAFARGMFSQLVQRFGDVELDIEIRHVPPDATREEVEVDAEEVT